MTNRRCDVVVVGAGYAGLSAALRLHDAGLDVLVLEARDRVAGRVLSERRPTGPHGIVIDHGGQWVGPTQRHLLALADRFDCTTFESIDAGRHVEVRPDGQTLDFDGLSPTDAPGAAAYDAMIEELERIAGTVDVQAPWATPDADELDAQSVGDFARARTEDPDALDRLALYVQGIWCTEPDELSLLHAAFYMAAAGGYEQLMGTHDCAQDSRFHEGADVTAKAVATLLGDRLLLRTEVTGIETTATGVRVTAGETVVEAERAVVALPPWAVLGLHVEPPLPASRQRWLQAASMGRVAKVHAVYESAFWREAGLSGTSMHYKRGGTAGVVMDNSPEDVSVGAIVVFIYSDRLDAWLALDAEQRRAAVLDDLALALGPAALEPIDYTEQRWTQEPYSRGGYEAFQRPGAWVSAGPQGWREPTGPLHWAGTETSHVWNGYISGAIASGERAADEVAVALGAARACGS